MHEFSIHLNNYCSFLIELFLAVAVQVYFSSTVNGKDVIVQCPRVRYSQKHFQQTHVKYVTFIKYNIVNNSFR